MSYWYFNAKMHQIRFLPGLPQTLLGELTLLPRPCSCMGGGFVNLIAVITYGPILKLIFETRILLISLFL